MLFREDIYLKYNKKKQLFYALAILLVIASLGIGTALVFLSTRETQLAIKALGSIGLTLLIWAAILCFFIGRSSAKYAYVYGAILHGEASEINARVISISANAITLQDDTKVIEIVLEGEDGKRRFARLLQVIDAKIEEGKSYRFEFVSEYIRGIYES